MGLLRIMLAFLLVNTLLIIHNDSKAFPGEPGGGSEPTPAMPASATVPSSSSSGNFTLSWANVVGESHYLWREYANGSWSVWNNAARDVTSVALTNRSNGSYYYQVKACSLSALPACSSAKQSNTITVSLISIPGSISTVNISDGATSNDGAYYVTWSAASNSPTRYEYLESINGSWGTQWVSTGLSRSTNISGNGNGTYAYKVRACNAAGCGASKTSSNVVVSIPSNVGGLGWKNTSGSIPDAAWNGDTPVLTGNTNVGALEGSGGVSGGAASYNIPIVIPPGRAGMQPSVSLSYSSRSGNGIAGVGWSLSSGSSIHRCSATPAQDRFGKGVIYSNNDKLCLDGQRLVIYSGVYGQSGAVYRTELDSFAKIVQSGDTNASSSFMVYHKDGRISKYGLSANSQHKASGKTRILSWAIAEVQDRSQNTITYDYLNLANGENLLDAIHYTGTNGSDGNRHVRMIYENRPDLSRSYLAGGLTSSSKRLQKIQTQYQSQTIREYRLRYDASSASSKRSLLRGVTECGFVGGTACLPETIIDWQDASNLVSRQQVAGAGVSLIPTHDFDGDAVKEIVKSSEIITQSEGGLEVHYTQNILLSYSSDGSLKWEKSLGSTDGLITTTELGQQRVSGKVSDINNNGIPDVLSSKEINSSTSEFIVKEFDSSSAEAFANTIANTGAFKVDPPSVGIDFVSSPGGGFDGVHWSGFQDVNADGKQDIVYPEFVPYNSGSTHSKTQIKVHYNTTVNNQISFDANGTVLGAYSNKNTKGPVQNPQAKYLYRLQGMQDLDGNGLSDMMLWNSYCGTSRASQTDVAFNIDGNFVNGNYLNMGIHANNLPHETYHIWTDINGDGLSDYLFIPNRRTSASKTWHYQLNKGYAQNVGATFAPVVNTGSSFGMVATDFNWSESLMKDECGDYIKRYTPKFAQILQVADFDNDGVSELLAPSSEIPVTRACVVSEEAIDPEPGRAPTGDTPEASPELIYEYCAYNQSGAASGELYAAGLGKRDRSIYNFKAHKFHLNSAGNFTLQEVTNSSHLVRANERQGSYKDLNGDGLLDVLLNTYNANDPHHWIRWRWDEALPAGIQADKTYIQKSQYQGGNSYLNTPDTVKKITNGLGVTQEWSYSPISHNAGRSATKPTLYQVPGIADNNRYVDDKYFYFTSVMNVVDSFKHSDGIGGVNEKQYSYREAIYNNQGRSFQGFRTVVVDDLSDTDPNKHIRSVSDFHQKFPLSGKLEQTRTCLIASGGEHCKVKPISKAEYSWDMRRAQNGGALGVVFPNIDSVSDNFSSQIKDGDDSLTSASYRYWVSPRAQKQYAFETDSSHNQDMTVSSNWLSEQFKTYTFDGNGCAVSSTSRYQESVSGKNKVETESAMANTSDIGAWWLCRVDSQTVTTKAVANRDISEPAGFAAIESGADVQKQVRTNYVFDSSNWKPTKVTTYATQGQGTANGLQSVVDTQYNSYGLPTSVVSDGDNYTGANMADRSVSTTYSTDGYFVKTVTNSKGHITTTEVDPIHGQATKVIDPNLQETTMAYDAFGRVRSTKLPGEPTQWTAYYWCAGFSENCPENTKYLTLASAMGSPDNRSFMDSFNRSTMSQTRSFDGLKWSTVTSSFNNKGQKTFESIPHLITNTNSLETRGTKYLAFDALGRINKKQTPQANDSDMTTYYDYDGFVTTVKVDEAGGSGYLEMERKYNGLGQLVYTKDALNGYTRYAYDGAGNPITLQDANGNKIYAKYNALGHKEYVDDPNMGKKFFWYNTFGEVEKEQDANNDVLTYSYDTLGRLYRRWTNGQISGDWLWDYPNAAGGRKGKLFWEQNSVSGNKRQIKYYFYATTSSGKDYLSYNRYHTIDGDDDFQNIVFHYVDNNYGRPKGMKYNTTGLTLSYDYNDRGYMTKIKNANGGYVYQEIKDLDAHGKITQQLKTNGLLTESAIDSSNPMYHPATGQMLSIRTATTYGNELRHELTYTYDGFSNLDMQTVRANGITNAEDYHYDKLHRLESSYRTINNGSSITVDPIQYYYDAVGNIKKKTDYSTTSNSSYSYPSNGTRNTGNGGPNAVQSVALRAGGTAHFTYDRNGNMKTAHGKEITYNEFNKPLTVEKNNIKSSFSYGADLMRYKQIKEGLSGGKTETTFYVDKLFEKVETRINNNLSKTEYKHYIGDVAIQTKSVTGSTSNWDIRFTHRDRLGSVVTLTDDKGLVTEHRSYDAFGKPRKGDFGDVSPATLRAVALNDSGSDSVPFTTRGFTDHEHLDDAELIHMNGRAYDYNLGRFLSVDPFIQAPGNSQSMNPYSYIMNNPLAGTDPSGYTAICNYGMSMSCQGETKSEPKKPEKEGDNGKEDKKRKVKKIEEIMKRKFGRIEVYADGSVKIKAQDGSFFEGKGRGVQKYLFSLKKNKYGLVYKGRSGGTIKAKNEGRDFYKDVYSIIAVQAAANIDVLEHSTLNNNVLVREGEESKWSHNGSKTHTIIFARNHGFKGQSSSSGLIHELGHAAHFNVLTASGVDYYKSKYFEFTNSAKTEGKSSQEGENYVTRTYETLWVKYMNEKVRKSYKPTCSGHGSCGGASSSKDVWKIWR